MSKNLLQNTFKQLKCSQQGHQNQPLNYLCITSDCQNNSLICYLCHLEKHDQHDKLPLKVFINKLISIESNSINLIPLSSQIDRILQQIKNNLIKYKTNYQNQDLIFKTFESFKQLNIKSSLQFYQLVQKINDLLSIKIGTKIIQQLNKFVKQYYFKYFGDIQEKQWVTINLHENLLQAKIQQLKSIVTAIQKLNNTHKINDTNILNLFPLQIQEQSKKIKVYFTEQLKAPPLTLVSSTHAVIEKSGTERLTIMEPCLSRTFGVKKWGIKIIKLASWIGVGVCHINQIKKANFNFNYTNTGHGSYLISSNGYSWSSYKKQFNSHFEPFTFGTGDIIQIEYDPKQKFVHFRKQTDPNYPTYKLQVQSNDDPIHPQINMTGIGDQVQIINY